MSTMVRERPALASIAGTMDRARVLRLAVPVGRLLFALIFLGSLAPHFAAGTIAYAAQQGVPFANILVPLSGVMAFVGGLSVLLGYRARLGAALLVLFLVPVTLMMHGYWAVGDPMMAQLEQAMFMKNVALTGAALVIMGQGAGPLSLDERQRRSAAG